MNEQRPVGAWVGIGAIALVVVLAVFVASQSEQRRQSAENVGDAYARRILVQNCILTYGEAADACIRDLDNAP